MTTLTREFDNIYTKNAKTGKRQVIKQYDIEIVDWGFKFYVDSESDAYRAAYEFQGGGRVKVEFAKGILRWMVTVFNKDYVG